ncbi:3-hydroxyacyl-CoA dehydrogenase/enoyl-CoA hydratase family protein [Sulfodiicoccus acidiphilus]|nr:3-hydroxyacyl-CoA dehydrogenase/enoyl-CoA hydratase family protein [Sulfodiicoccus acidiphilus]
MKVVVVGAGEMGHGIAEVFAIAGHSVGMVDVKREFLEKGLGRIRESLSKLEEKGRLKEPSSVVVARISTSTDLEAAVRDADFVVEAVPEVVDLKRDVFRRLDSSTRPDAILASNTSNIRITTLAEATSHPERVVGMHFFNPAVVMQLVEVIRGERTSEDAVQRTVEVTKNIGKVPVVVRKDVPGFIVNRINAAETLFFCLLVQRGINVQDVDSTARAQGLPMGPYELMDFVGIDVAYHSLEYFAKEVSPDYGQCTVLRDMVNSGSLGKKSGRGFYDWSKGRPEVRGNPGTLDLADVIAIEINEAVKLVEMGVASPQDVETAVKLGMNRPFGPISAAKAFRSSEVAERLERISRELNSTVFSPAQSIREGRMRDVLEGRVQQPTTDAVRLERMGKVALLKINRPRLNLINGEVIEALDRAIEQLWSDQSVTVVLVTGEGENTSAGAELSSFFRDPFQFLEFGRKGERTFRKLSEIPKVTVALMKGYVLGGGLELSLACDIRLATEDAQVGFPEVGLGLVPGWGGTQRLARLIGASRALFYVLTTERMSGKQAAEMGLVNRIVKDEEEALKFASELSDRVAPVAAALAKRLINKAAEVPSDVGLEMESFASGVLFGTEDLKEGISAFMQKRKPQFKGR